MFRLLISTGEVSGDLQGSFLVEALYKQAEKLGLSIQVVALGGPRMRAAGAELIADTASMGAIGLWEALPFVLPTFFGFILALIRTPAISAINVFQPSQMLFNIYFKTDKIQEQSPHQKLIKTKE